VDYYIYSDFTENPGNQCFVHSKESCKACLAKCKNPPPPASAYYLPQAAYIHGGPCVDSPADCGEKGLEHVLAAYGAGTALALWEHVELKLKQGSVRRTVFDELLR